jgi:hypothetical protein
MLTFGNVAGEQFDRAQAAAVDLAARMGTDLQSATLMVGKALNAPAKGIAALSRAGIQFTEQQKAQIKAMSAAGDTAGAQKIMLAELEKQFKGSAKAMRDADPSAALTNSWSDFQEVVGEIALRVLPPITDALSRAVDQFNDLSPGMQTAAVAGMAIAAAAGPVLAAFGGLVSLSAPLLASFGTAGGVTVGLTGLAPILGPLALNLGAVALAWQNWEKIGPWIDGVMQRTTSGVADINAKLASIQQAADNFDRRMGTPSKDEFLKSATKLFGDFWTWLNSYDLSVWARNVDAQAVQVWESFKRLHARAQSEFTSMVDGISQQITARLAPIWGKLKAQTVAAGDHFHTLWDRVVGHSYVPDMVDEIGVQMARLQGNMVNVAKSATSATGKAFQDLRAELAPILDRLFPELAAENKFRAELAILEKDMKRLGFTADQTAEAIDRLRAEKRNGLGGAPAAEAVTSGFAERDLGEGGTLDAVNGIKLPALDDARASAEQFRTILGAIGANGQGAFTDIAGAVTTY